MKENTLVLAGGGHTHALLLKALQKHPLPCRLILLSSTRYTPYSGMLPGVIAGVYQPEEAHIDLKVLAESSGSEFIEDEITGLAADSNELTTLNGQTLKYDALSINTGSTQSRVVDGPDCISIKPVKRFLPWLSEEFQERLNQFEQQSKVFNLVIVGGGAAGVEVAMALRERFRYSTALTVHIITSNGVVPGHSPAVRQLITNELVQKGIKVHASFQVATVLDHCISSLSGQHLPYDQVILATPACPAPWPAHSGLSTDRTGFIRVNPFLQSCSHDNVFASGDIAAFTEAALAKCGVYAVRQAPVLHQNLKAWLTGQPLQPYQPQQQFLSLLSCADGRAIASRGAFRAKGGLVWLWKNWIDKRFMAQFPLPLPGSMGSSAAS
ncbi:FAD-dependent oxidoreductase [Endozoicomonas lisbonensis]|uniref:Pyridine nucleotide-disulfide oxidoreductase family protein n=1 Tax=Endozoicomonas lisbonensis TaxID=3120522 RepID=A0ABV2SKA4_9GAMM